MTPWGDSVSIAPAQRFFGRRIGRGLGPARRRRLEQALPRVAIADGAGPIDVAGLFARSVADVWLEVGFGAGEHLLCQARDHPDVGLIGCEPYLNGVAALLRGLGQGVDAGDRETLPPAPAVRIWPDDARPLIARLGDGVIGRVFVLFPDPWPKKRHQMRRIIGPETLPQLARVMRDGAELRLASDHPLMLRWMLYHLARDRCFHWLDEGPGDWYRRRSDWPATRYEEKSLAGRPTYLRYVRRPRDVAPQQTA